MIRASPLRPGATGIFPPLWRELALNLAKYMQHGKIEFVIGEPNLNESEYGFWKQ